MTFEYTRAARSDKVRQMKETEDAINDAAEGGDGGTDLGSYNSIEQLVLDGTPVGLDPEIHTSWLQTSGNGPTALVLINPLPFSVGLRKLIYMTDWTPGDNATLNTGFIKNTNGSSLSSIVFGTAPCWVLLEAWDTDFWRVVRSSGATIT